MLAELTLREVMGVILPKVERPSTPQEPPSTTQHPLPKSFGIVLSWPDFRKGSQALYGSLNNTDRLYTVPTYDIVDGESDQSPGHELEVRELLMRMLKGVNTAATVLGIPKKYSCGEAAATCRSQT